MSVNERNRATSVDNKIRQREMKVLVMGMGRTGTTGDTVEEAVFSSHRTDSLRAAMAAALKQLGFVPYDYLDRSLKGHFRLWDDAMRAKFQGVGKPWGRQEFDRVTSEFDVICSLKIDSGGMLIMF